MIEILFIALGGALGAVSRYGLSGVFFQMLGPGFPYGTLVVNVTGSFVLGIVIGLGAHHLVLSEQFKMFFVTGFLGGFTTFSTFSLNVVTLFERGEALQACVYVIASVFLSVAMLLAGVMVTRMGSSL